MILQSLMEDLGPFFSRRPCGTHPALQSLPRNVGLSVLTSPSRQPFPRPAVPGSSGSSSRAELPSEGQLGGPSSQDTRSHQPSLSTPGLSVLVLTAGLHQ